MPLHEFTMIVEGPDLQDEGLIDALFEAGCDDALVGRTDGIQYLDIGREADTFEAAVFTAIADVESVAGVKVVRLAEIGLLSMADIAARTGRTRESVRLLVAGKRGPGGFPHRSPTREAGIACGGPTRCTAGLGRAWANRLSVGIAT